MRKKKIINLTPRTFIDERVTLSKGCSVGPGSFLVGDIHLLEKVLVDPCVVIIGRATIGQNAYIGAYSIIGYPPRAELRSIRAAQSYESFIESQDETTLGESALLRTGCVIYKSVKLGKNVELGHNVLLRENVSVGDNTLIGTNTVIDGSTSIGSRVSIQSNVYIPAYSTIKDSVFLGPNAVLLNDKYAMQKKTQLKGPTIETGSSIGGNSVIMPGVTIGEGVVVGASSLVTRDVPPNTVVVGTPAKTLRVKPSEWRSLLLT